MELRLLLATIRNTFDGKTGKTVHRVNEIQGYGWARSPSAEMTIPQAGLIFH